MENPRLSFVPFFVLMTIAPFWPREPYNAAALGPFKTVYVSMSSAGMFHVSDTTGTPSTTINKLVSPRKTNCGLPSISDEGPTVSPATFPTKEFMGLGSRALTKSLP